MMKIFKRKDRKAKALEAINSHHGKRRVYEKYLRENPTIAEKYLKFIERNVDATYISWDKEKQVFCG